MNIFYVDPDPAGAAEMLTPKVARKMIIESCQMLSTAHWATGSQGPYKPTHSNHPCSIWVRSSIANYRWLIDHTEALLVWYYLRLERHRLPERLGRHACQPVWAWLKVNEPPLPDVDLTPPAQAMPEQYRGKDPVAAYRRYWHGEKAYIGPHSVPPA